MSHRHPALQSGRACVKYVNYLRTSVTLLNADGLSFAKQFNYLNKQKPCQIYFMLLQSF